MELAGTVPMYVQFPPFSRSILKEVSLLELSIHDKPICVLEAAAAESDVGAAGSWTGPVELVVALTGPLVEDEPAAFASLIR